VTGGIFTTDDLIHNFPLPNVIDLLDEVGLTWKTYQADYPGSCFTGANYQGYIRSHNPFISMSNIQENSTRCSLIVNAEELMEDLYSGNLTDFMYYTPNIYQSGLYGLNSASTFMKSFMEDVIPQFPEGTLVFVVFDHDALSVDTNHVYVVAHGSMIEPGSSDAHYYTHYSLLRLVEDNWNLHRLTLKEDDAKLIELLPHDLDNSKFNHTLPYEIPLEFDTMMIIALVTCLLFICMSIICICCCVESIRIRCCPCCGGDQIIYLKDTDIPLTPLRSSKKKNKPKNSTTKFPQNLALRKKSKKTVENASLLMDDPDPDE